MRTLLRILVYVPLGLIILFFAATNREPVTIHLEALHNADSEIAETYKAPLYLIVLGAMALGVLAGGISSWIGHRPLRRAAKEARAEAKTARVEVEQLRQQALSSLPADASEKERRR